MTAPRIPEAPGGNPIVQMGSNVAWGTLLSIVCATMPVRARHAKEAGDA